MTTFTKLALGTVMASALAVPAIAGGLETPVVEPQVAPVIVPSTDWTGGYAGLQLGYGDVSGDLEGDDWLGGVQAGYDWDLGNWVVGLGADANFGAIETDAGDLDTLSRLKVRGGYDFGSTLLFASTGASYATGDALADDSWGYFGGIGVETMVSDRVSLTAEVAQHRFEDDDTFGTVDATVGTVGVNYRF